MDEKEKQQALEEEQARLQALKVTTHPHPTALLPPPPLYYTGEGRAANTRWAFSAGCRCCVAVELSAHTQPSLPFLYDFFFFFLFIK